MAIYDIYGNLISGGSSGDSGIWAGKKLCMMGDSITQYVGSDLTNYMILHNGFDTAANWGHAGTTWETDNGATTKDNTGVGMVNQLIANAQLYGDTYISDYDCVTIALGTNMSAMGTISDTKEDVDTMCGAMRYCLENLLYWGRVNVSIGVIIPPQRVDNHGKLEGAYEERCELIKRIAHQYSIPTLDLYHEGQIVPDDITDLGPMHYLGDGLHLGTNGARQYMMKISRWLNTF